ncbi:hypothetical protein K9B32_21155 [Rhizobium sp. 3T7]|uniref:hypothetical protein n=1 Tax=Rhizobium sp. 3T7 TaxID=2874922 RepID=UPI001CCC5DA0|nr:hypothetical protein [Rhizobium sp. 3T7]MBZ9792591.1 hypothetical protein [Rhizobium sp. 3T7]
MARAIAAAQANGIGHIVFDQRDHLAANLMLTLDPIAGRRGVLSDPKGTVNLASVSGVYVRLMDERFLPNIIELPLIHRKGYARRASMRCCRIG